LDVAKLISNKGGVPQYVYSCGAWLTFFSIVPMYSSENKDMLIKYQIFILLIDFSNYANVHQGYGRGGS
jgi:hypothetical protein